MRGEEFLNRIGNIDEKYIEAAEKIPRKRRRNAALLAAACLGLVIAGTMLFGGIKDAFGPEKGSEGEGSDDMRQEELSPLSFGKPSFDGHGIEGFNYHDISEYANGNPWTEDCGITVLPVYENDIYDPTGAGAPHAGYLSAREMKEQLKKAASILGLRIKPGSFEEQHAGRTSEGILTGLKAETEDGVLTVSSVGDISYRPSVGIIELPDEVLGDASSKEWSEDTVRYILSLYEKLSEALGLRNPTVVVDGHYIFTGEYWQTRIFVYESSDDPVENILSYTYPKLGLVKYYDGSFGGFGFSLAEKDNIVPGKKLGEYPIVSTSDAKDRLLSGFYASSCPDSIKGEEYIAKTELVYRHSIHDQYVMPYYRFWVMLDYYANENAEKNGLKTYAAYYVPALPDEYIADLTAWNGLFN